MKRIIIDEVLIINLYSGKKKWMAGVPRRLSAYEVAIRIKGKVNIPDWLPLIDVGEIDIPEIEAAAEASMG